MLQKSFFNGALFGKPIFSDPLIVGINKADRRIPTNPQEILSLLPKTDKGNFISNVGILAESYFAVGRRVNGSCQGNEKTKFGDLRGGFLCIVIDPCSYGLLEPCQEFARQRGTAKLGEI